MRIAVKANFSALNVELSRLVDMLDADTIGKALQKGGEIIRKETYNRTHVITTDLRESWAVGRPHQEDGATTVRIGTNIVYAVVEHEGGDLPISDKQRAYLHANTDIHPRASTTAIHRDSHPSLAPAFYDKEREVLEEIAGELREEFR